MWSFLKGKAIACDGGDSCCKNGICGEMEGDCDRDSDCKKGNKWQAHAKSISFKMKSSHRLEFLIWLQTR